MQDQPHILLHLLGKLKAAGSGQGLTLGTYKLWACTSWLRALSALPAAPWGRVGYPAREGDRWGDGEQPVCMVQQSLGSPGVMI